MTFPYASLGMPLKVADVPGKADLLEMLDELRADVESGKTFALVAIPINVGREFTVRFRGEIRMLELVGLLERAKLDAARELSA